MMNDDYRELVGKWLIFSPGTLFGDSKQHFGIVVCCRRGYGLAVAVSSQLEKRVLEWERNQYPKETLIILESKSFKSGYHFSKTSVIDCNSTCEVKFEELEAWLESGGVVRANHNEDVDLDLLKDVRSGILCSPRVLPRLKKMLSED